MENNIVFPDEVNQFCVLLFPVRLPIFTFTQSPFFGRRNIANWRIKPYVQFLSRSAFNRNINAPIKVARHGAASRGR